MKTQKLYLAGTAVLAAVVLFSGRGAVSAQTPPGAPAPGGAFAQRLEQRKQERQITLNEKDTNRLAQRCVSVQGEIREIQQKAGTTFSNRTKVYQRIDGKLWVTIGQLKLAERDTFELEKQRLALAEKAAAFQTLGTHYQQTLDDLVVINCQADVVGFKALLDTARLYHEQVRTSSADIRGFVIDKIKPILATHATEMQPKPATEGGR